jgi:hypothetical protein
MNSRAIHLLNYSCSLMYGLLTMCVIFCYSVGEQVMHIIVRSDHSEYRLAKAKSS